MLSAKFLTPQAADALVRERLVKRLVEAQPGTSFWLHAPGGYGKSTLAASYIHARHANHLWYRVDHGDIDLAAFVDQLAKAARAVEHIAAKDERSLPGAGMLSGGALIQFSREFFRAFFASVQKPFVLVFDEIQALPNDSATVLALAAACEEVQDGILLLLLSRNLPPPVCSRLEVNGSLELLRPAELRFTIDETRALLLQNGFKIIDSRLDALHRRTHGWAAAIRLLLRVVAVDNSGGDLLESDQKRLLAGYFTSEVLVGVDQQLLDDLMTLALCDSLPLELVTRLTPSPSIPALLKSLADEKLFVDRLEGNVPVYRMHPMFRDFLNDRMIEQKSTELILSLKRRAAIVLLEQEQYDEAIELFRDCGAVDQVCATIARHGPALVTRAQFVRLREWLSMVPKEVRASDPWMMYWDGASLLFTEASQAKQFMATAYEAFDARDDAIGTVLSWSGYLDAVFNEYAVLSQLDVWLDRFDSKIAPRLAGLDPSIAGRAIVSRFNALIFRRPDDPGLPSLSAQVAAMAQHIPDPEIVAFIRCQLFLRALWCGDLPAAEIELAVLRDLAARADAPLMTRLFTLLNSAAFNLFTGALLDCECDVTAGLALTEQSNLHLWDAVLYGHHVSALIALGRLKDAEACLPALRQSQIHERHSEISRYHGFMAWFAAKKRGAGAQAIRYMSQSLQDVDLGGVPMFQAIARLTIADARIAIDPADPLIAHLLDEALTIGLKIANPMLEWISLTALIGYRALRGTTEVDMAMVEHAFNIGARNHYRHFITWPSALVGLACEVALRNGVQREYTRELIRHNKLTPTPAAYSLDDWPWPVTIRTLGRFVVHVNDEVPPSGKKRPKVLLRLLQFLIAADGRNVSEQRICDRLWPNAEADKAADSLAISLHRLREFLQIDDCIVRQSGRLSLNNKLVWVDVWALERAIKNGRTSTPLTPAQILTIYQGQFLNFEDDIAWAIPLRTRLHDEVVGYIKKRVKELMQLGDWAGAEEYCECGLRIDDLDEEFYRGVMQCQLNSGNRAKVAGTFRRCENVFQARLHAAPDQQTREIFVRSLVGGS